MVGEGLRCGLLGVVQGPITLTYRVRLMQPSPGALRRLLGMGPALTQALQCSTVRVGQGEGAVLIEVPLPTAAQRTPTALDMTRHTAGLRVAVGMDAMRRPVHVDLQQHGAVFWIGPSRRGKTQSLRCTLYALAAVGGERIHYAILSQKRADWIAFEGAAGCLGIVSSAAEALEVLRWAVAVLQRRAESGKMGRRLVLVADDLLNLLAAEPSLADPLGEISSMGAGLGVHLLAGTQEGGSRRGTGGAAVENNATARVLYRSSSAAAGARAAGQGGLGIEALSSARGDALLIVDGEQMRIATGWAEDSVIAQLPGGGEQLRSPWAARSTQPAATGAHQLQPAQPGGEAPSEAAHGEHGVGGEAQPGAAQPAALFPISKRPPTAEEQRAILALHAEGLSLNALCRAVYGHKDGRAYGWIKAVLSEPSAHNVAQDAGSGAEGMAEPETVVVA